MKKSILTKAFLWMTMSIALLLSSCASMYHPMPIRNNIFVNSQESQGIEYSYKYDILYTYGNKKYAKKEKRKGINVIALKITNRTSEPISINNLRIKTGNSEIFPINSQMVAKELRQCVPCYLFYGLLFLNLYQYNGYRTDVTSIPIGVPIALFNMFKAIVANKGLKDDLIHYDIKGKLINPGETLSGVIGTRSLNYEPIKIELKTVPEKD